MQSENYLSHKLPLHLRTEHANERNRNRGDDDSDNVATAKTSHDKSLQVSKVDRKQSIERITKDPLVELSETNLQFPTILATSR